MNTKNLVGIVIAVLVAFGLGYALHGGSSSPATAGAANPTGNMHYQMEGFQQGAAFGSRNQTYFDNVGRFTLGASGTTLTNVIATTCTGIVYASLAATTTQQFDCAVTGALTTAKFVHFSVASLPTVAGGNFNNLVVWGGRASTTAGYVSGYLTNLTGAATTSYAQATTSMPVLVIQ